MRWISKAGLAAGCWLLVAPWALGYATVTSALWNDLVVGIFLTLIFLWRRFGISGGSSQER